MKLKGLLHVTFAYLVTLGIAWTTLQALGKSPIWDMFWADIAATIATCKALHIRCSVISLAAEVRIYRYVFLKRVLPASSSR